MIVSLTAYLRQLGYKGLVTDANFQTKLCQALIRENVDYVDQHDYWSHKYLKSLYYLRNNHSIIDYCAAVPRLIMTARILGKPFMVTEFNFDPPNNFRAEGGPVMAAYSALQGWGAIFRYAYSHTVKKLLVPHRIEHIDVACDPLSFFSEKIGILLYRRNDVKEAGTAIPYAYNRNVLKLEGILSPKKAGIPENYSYLGLYSKIGLVKVEPGQKLPSEYSCGFTNKNFGIKADERLLITDLSNTKFVNTLADRRIIKPGHIDIKKKFFLSETGQICIDGANGSLKIVTPKSECLILKAGKALKGKNVQVKDPKTRSVVFVSAMDGKDLADSGRILILFLTDLQNSKLKTILRDSNLYVKDWGSLPHLIRLGQVQVSILNNAANASWDLWAVDMSGKRVVKIAAKVQNGKIILDLKNLVKQKTYMAFELVKADNS
jgi:hypothetical protein